MINLTFSQVFNACKKNLSNKFLWNLNIRYKKFVVVEFLLGLMKLAINQNIIMYNLSVPLIEFLSGSVEKRYGGQKFHKVVFYYFYF